MSVSKRALLGETMDALYVGLIVAFLALILAFAAGCERLEGKQ